MTPPLATGATAGTPGTWTPGGSRAATSVAEMNTNTITATPATAWTTGQHVLLSDGVAKAHWSGTTWVTGQALVARATGK